MSREVRDSVGRTAQTACVLEVMAPKAGNVHPGAELGMQSEVEGETDVQGEVGPRPGRAGAWDGDEAWLDFVVSAIAVRPVLDRAAELGVGRTVLQCVRATREAVGTNTNLGIVLLLAPLCAVRDEVPLERGVRAVLDSLSREDAQLTYEAIRLAKPGGLGRAAAQDVNDAPTVSLVEAMRLAADRDAVARQYVNGFADVFAVADELATDELPLDELIVRAHLRRMAAEPDSLIARKAGRDEAVESRRRAAAVLDAGWPAGEAARGAFARLDRWLREAGGRRNPGTSADLIAAGLYVALRAGRLTPPFRWASPVGAEDAAGGRSSC